MRTRYLFPLILTGLIATHALAGRSMAQCPGESQTLLGGVQDDFVPPDEAPEPSKTLVEYAESSWPQIADRQFDSTVSDRSLIHTFAGIAPDACGAYLDLHLRATSDPLSENDTVRLELLGGPDPVAAFLYVTTIRNVVGSWGPGSEATIVLNLTDLPPYVDFPTNILAAVDDGSLDLLIEDDTAVDYALLRVCYCANVTEHESWGRLKTLFR